MTIKVEITSSPDTAAIAAVHDACFTRSWSSAAIDEILSIIGTVAVIARSETGQAIGFGLLRLLGNEAEILTLAVLPAHRRSSVGDAVLRSMLTWSNQKKIASIMLEVDEHNVAACKMYEKNGFSIISRRNEYYQNEDGSRSHALVMRRMLP